MPILQRNSLWLSGFLLSLLALQIAGSAAAETSYPEKPISMVVGLPSGSTVDAVARLLGQKLAEALGQPVMIDNVTGAAGNIAADRAAKAAPDGYTLGLVGQGPLVINPSLYKLVYEPLSDFAPVSQIYTSMFILVVSNAISARSVKELVALAKAQPGGLTFASSGTGSGPDMAVELLKSAAGIDIRPIPYKGSVAAIPDLLDGRVTMMFSTTVVVLPLVREGKLRALAVTSSRRSSAHPTAPTIAESGYPGFEHTSWYGLLAPARTPAAIVRKLHGETVKALAQADVRAQFADLGVEGIGNSPDEFAAVIKSEIPIWAKVIKDSGIKPD